VEREVEAAWATVAEERLAACRRGEETMLDGPAVLAEFRSRYQAWPFALLRLRGATSRMRSNTMTAPFLDWAWSSWTKWNERSCGSSGSRMLGREFLRTTVGADCDGSRMELSILSRTMRSWFQPYSTRVASLMVGRIESESRKAWVGAQAITRSVPALRLRARELRDLDLGRSSYGAGVLGCGCRMAFGDALFGWSSFKKKKFS
jgi:hypothetical protein